MVKIIYQQVTEDGKFLLGLEGLSSDTKPTGGVIADGSTFKETDTDGEYYLDTTWKVAKAGQMKNLPTVSVSDNGKIPKVIEGAWGLGTDETGGSSYTLPTASASTKGGVKIGSGLSMDGEVLSATGGAEKFVVTFSFESDTLVADKTIAEIVEADEAGQEIVGVYPNSGFNVNTRLTICTTVGTTSVAVFEAPYSIDPSAASLVAIMGINTGESDSWTGNEFPLTQELPSYSSSNNGQVLGVSSGSLAWVDSNAPLIVTMGDDGSDGLVGDKTFSEIATAANANKPVLIKWSDSTESIAYNVVSVYVAQEQGQTIYQVSYIEGNAVMVSEGSANDYFVYAS